MQLIDYCTNPSNFVFSTLPTLPIQLYFYIFVIMLKIAIILDVTCSQIPDHLQENLEERGGGLFKHRCIIHNRSPMMLPIHRGG